jgi:hypothetical protein
MLHVPVGANTYGLTLPSWGTSRPAAANGTAITPGAGDYGSWAQVGNALSADAYGILININSNYTSAASRNTVVDIGVDLAGGTSFTAVISGLLCGNADTYISGGRSGSGVWYYFPLFIPSGSTVGARGHSTVVTAFRVGIILMQQPVNPAAIRKGSFVETLGISGNQGTAITPGTTAESAWVSVGTTAKRCWWWQLGWQIPSTDTSHVGAAIHLDMAIDSGGLTKIIIDFPANTSTQEALTGPPLTSGVEWDVPAGTTLYVRAQSSGNAEASQVAIYGLGG